MSDREKAIQAARELHATGRYDKPTACTVTLNAFPELKLSRDQLKALAFPAGTRWYGFGELVPSSSAEARAAAAEEEQKS
jgi:hypothetical protein